MNVFENRFIPKDGPLVVQHKDESVRLDWNGDVLRVQGQGSVSLSGTHSGNLVVAGGVSLFLQSLKGDAFIYDNAIAEIPRSYGAVAVTDKVRFFATTVSGDFEIGGEANAWMQMLRGNLLSTRFGSLVLCSGTRLARATGNSRVVAKYLVEGVVCDDHAEIYCPSIRGQVLTGESGRVIRDAALVADFFDGDRPILPDCKPDHQPSMGISCKG